MVQKSEENTRTEKGWQMHNDEQDASLLKWDSRFRSEECVLGTNPSRYLVDNMDLIASLVPGIRALDIACGEGRNCLYLAKRGFQVTGLDISAAGLEKGRLWMEREGVQIDFRLVNLEKYEFTEQYDLILNCNFLLRDLVPKSVGSTVSWRHHTIRHPVGFAVCSDHPQKGVSSPTGGACQDFPNISRRNPGTERNALR